MFVDLNLKRECALQAKPSNLLSNVADMNRQLSFLQLFTGRHTLDFMYTIMRLYRSPGSNWASGLNVIRTQAASRLSCLCSEH